MDSKGAYRLRSKILKRKYSAIAEEFKQYKDDRLLVTNMLEQLLETCKCIETVENAFISVAVNKHIKEQEAVMDSIVTRFTGKVYKDNRWQLIPLYHVYRAQNTEGPKDRWNVMIKSTDDGEAAFRLGKQLQKLGNDVYITVDRPDGSEDRIWN